MDELSIFQQSLFGEDDVTKSVIRGGEIYHQS
jgi:hypothetical protein